MPAVVDYAFDKFLIVILNDLMKLFHKLLKYLEVMAIRFSRVPKITALGGMSVDFEFFTGPTLGLALK